MWGSAADHDRHPLLWSDGPMQTVMHPPPKRTSSHHVRGWHSLCIGVCHTWDRCTSPTPCKPTSKGSEGMMTPQENSGWVVTKCSASKTSLGLINGKLWLLPWTSTGASTYDGWRLQVMCSGCGCLKEHIYLAEGMTSVPVDAIGWWTPWLTQLLTELGHGLQGLKGGVMGKYPSMSGFMTNWCFLPWCRVLPPNRRGTIATNWRVALYPCFTKWEVSKQLYEGMPKLGGRLQGMPSPKLLDCNRQYPSIHCYEWS